MSVSSESVASQSMRYAFVPSLVRTVIAALIVAFVTVLAGDPAAAAPKKRTTASSEKSAGTVKGKRKVALSARAKAAKAAKARAARASKNRLAIARAKRAKTQTASRTRRSGGGIAWNAPGNCLPAPVKSALYAVVAKYGSITVNSTFRSRSYNRSVGGAGRSMHLECRAADFRVNSGGNGVLGFLQGLPGLGGIKRYRSGYFHIDNGPRRTWAG
jgi:Peptidase M15